MSNHIPTDKYVLMFTSHKTN